MITFNLRCGKEHVFEAWFKDGKSFDRQARQGKVACPVCGDSKVEKAPMAPNIASGVSRKSKATGGPDSKGGNLTTQAAEFRETLNKLRTEIEKNCDYVGENFAEEARKIHYKESEQRNIYGETTDQEAQALNDEGVDFARIPWPSRTNS